MSQTDRGLGRRAFIGCGAAFAAGFGKVVLGADICPSGQTNLQVGVLADIHLTASAPHADVRFEKALRYFDSRKADAVLLCGDIADYGLISELVRAGEIWDKVFPSNRRSDGAHIEKLFHFGDHDNGGYAHSRHPDYARRKAEIDRDAIFLADRKAVWRKAFHEDWSPILVKRVKGYTFVLGNHQCLDPAVDRYGDVVPGVDTALAALKPDPSKPFFYSQHRILRGTAGGADVWGQEAGVVTKILSNYPNCFAFCGHGHVQVTDERSIWQGAFTAVEVPSLRYLLQHPGRENGYCITDFKKNAQHPPQMKMTSTWGDGHGGLFMSVSDDAIVLERLDMDTHEKVGPDWLVPLARSAEKPYDHARRAKRDPAPVWPAGAQASVTFLKNGANRVGTKTDQYVVMFPSAPSVGSAPRAYDYAVKAIGTKGGVERTLCEKCVYSPYIYRSERRDRQLAMCVFATSELAGDYAALRFEMRPRNAFGRAGKPLVAAVAKS